MTDQKNSRWKIVSEQLRNKYRLVILNDDSFAEKFSLRLSPLGLIILIGSVTIVMTTLVISLVAFTPLREYIPGYGNVDDRRDLLKLTNRADSLEQTLSSREWYLKNLVNVFSGQVEGKPEKPKKDTTGKYSGIDIKPSDQDMELRRDIESGKMQSTSNLAAVKNPVLAGMFFFSPVKGIVTTSFDLSEEHYGVDVAAKENEFIKACLDGTVLFAGYTASDGYVVQIQHGSNIISVYKHCSHVSKKQGDLVKAGEPIAVVGNTGETSKGPHLHFEIWYNGIPLNPEEYVVF
ncbi:MAG: M23 family metallopeptidase [Bacteroidetes bacterium]|nr:M23 family metallopeptidase [Bacteroidota bacterium]